MALAAICSVSVRRWGVMELSFCCGTERGESGVDSEFEVG